MQPPTKTELPNSQGAVAEPAATVSASVRPTTEAAGGSSGSAQNRAARTSTVVVAARETVSPAATKQSVETLLRSILKRNPPTDRRALLQTLEQAFPAQKAGTAVSGGGVAVTGIAQAAALPTGQGSLYLRARAALNESAPRIRALRPHKPADVEDVEAYRQVVLTVFMKLVDELGRPGRPIQSRVGKAFEALLGLATDGELQPESLLGKFQSSLILKKDELVTSEERENWLSFQLVVDHLSALRHSWNQWKQSAERDPLVDVDKLLRTLTQLEQALNDFESAVDEAGVQAADRDIPLDDSKKLGTTLQQLLEWTHDVAGDEAPAVITAGGTKGVDLVGGLLRHLLQAWQSVSPDLHPRMDTPEVRLALQLVVKRLESAERLASGQTAAEAASAGSTGSAGQVVSGATGAKKK